jgi:hypothetical protein
VTRTGKVDASCSPAKCPSGWARAGAVRAARSTRTRMVASPAVVVVRVLVYATRSARRSGAVAGGSAHVVRARGNRMCTCGAAISGGATCGRRYADASIAPWANSLATWARPVTGRILCDARSVAVLGQIGRASLNASGTVAAHGSARRSLAGVDTLGQTAGGKGVVADASATTVVVTRIAANRTCAALTDCRPIRIRRTLCARSAASSGIAVCRAATPALVVAGATGERTSLAHRAAIA